MSSPLLVAFVLVLGAFGVLQAALNRQVAIASGLPPAVFFNTLVFLAMASLFLGLSRVAARSASDGPGLAASFRWWWVLPGFLGFCVVAGLPFAIQKIGAARVFVALVASQMATSLVWDAVVEKLPVTGTRLAGAALAVLGVLVASRR